MANDKSNAYVVGDFSFETVGDASLAETERKKVDYLRRHLETSNPDTVMALYKKIVAERIFKTPIGISFERELREYLLNADFTEEEVPAIPLYHRYSDGEERKGGVARKRIEPEKEKQKNPVSPLFVSVVLNIALVIGVIAMFWILLHSEQPNILNYEKALLNKYSYWEQELTEREQVIREKERELRISE